MAKQTKPRLGRGLSSLIGQPVEVTPPAAVQTKSEPTYPPNEGENGATLRSIPVVAIVPSPFQPRLDPTDADLEPLASSIRSSGVMQPIAVRPIPETDSRHHTGAHYELIAGERRWRAAQLAGLDHLPALVAMLSDQESAEWALVENIQRTDLSPIERAAALHKLAERFGLSHKRLAERLGLDRSTVSNLIRLTELEEEIKELLASALSVGHAKALLGMPAGRERVRLARLAAEKGWSVRRLEDIASAGAREKASRVDAHSRLPSPNIANIEKQLSDQLGTRVRLKTDVSGQKGRIQIEFFSLDQFDGILRVLGVELES